MTAALALFAVLVVAYAGWKEHRETRCPDCKGRMQPVDGWRKRECESCGFTK